MRYVADLHIHSHFSRATSHNLTFEHLARWAQLKGIQVVGTGDIAHPGWLKEMREKLEPAGDGLYRLTDEYTAAVQAQVPPACAAPVRFVLGGEISNIYKRDGQTRKVHNLVFAPDFAAVERLQARLEQIGNIRADGRPILGLDARDLLEITLETDPRCCLIPAHIWTPWFSLLGSKSGFDSVEACFADLTPHIFALETGLSSDPPMNWRVSALDRYTLVSNSDAHSPEKLGRETTLFAGELSYTAMFDALRAGDPARLGGTIEFFPEEGKYHFDGHRACGIAWDPPTTLAHGGICPVCGKPVTVGVMHRVEELADRPAGGRPPRILPFASLVPLPEVLGEAFGVGSGSRQVEAEYFRLLGRLGPELAILREVPLEDIAAVGGPRLAEGLGRMRRGEVVAQAGYDGEYGVIKIFAPAAGQAPAGQFGLFDVEPSPGPAPATAGAGPAAELQQQAAAEEPESYATGPVAGSPDLAGASPQPPKSTPPPGQAAPAGQAAAAPAQLEPEASAPLSRPASAARRTPAGGPEAAAPAPPAAHEPDRGPGDLLAGLNAEQQAAVFCTDAPLVIVAGPGTGKTRTLTVRLAYLIRQLGVAPEAILAITFTNKAAGEMAERLAALLGPATAARITIRTFHAFGALLLRSGGAARLGLDPNFTILADEDRRALLAAAWSDLRPPEVDRVLSQISAAKNDLLGSEAPELGGDDQGGPGWRAAYRAYEGALRAGSALDFDDLVLQPVRLLENHPDVLADLRARYHWISVDEYQDVNLAQYRLLRLLAAPPSELPGLPAGGVTPNLCVIGDPDQAIYGFRGADRRYFLRFQADYPGARVLQLSRNYRSTQLILDAAVQVINRRRDAGLDGPAPTPAALEAAEALAGFAEQVRLEVHAAATDRAEAEYVVHQIEQMVGGTSYFSLDSGRVGGSDSATPRAFADFAVLYRLGAQSRLLVEALARSGIPYQTVGQAPLYAHKAVREILAYLWLLRNPGSRLHLETILTTGQPALGDRALAQVRSCLTAAGGSLVDALGRAAAGSGLAPAQADRLSALAVFWRELAAGHTSRPLTDTIEGITGFVARNRAEPLSEGDAERLGQLKLRAVPYAADLAGFLDATTLQGETDAYDPRADRVALMSLHAAKGLEFPVVFIVGCEEGLLPYARPGAPPDIEEERRLFYVGLTRARHKLVLTSARARFLFGQRMENQPSRFVDDIESALKEAAAQAHRPRPKPGSTQLSLF